MASFPPSSVLLLASCAPYGQSGSGVPPPYLFAALRARSRALAEPLRLRYAPARPSSLRFARVGAPCALSRSRRGSLRSLRLRALGALRSRRRSSLCFGGSRGSFAWRAARLRPLGRRAVRVGAASGFASRFASRLSTASRFASRLKLRLASRAAFKSGRGVPPHFLISPLLSSESFFRHVQQEKVLQTSQHGCTWVHLGAPTLQYVSLREPPCNVKSS